MASNNLVYLPVVYLLRTLVYFIAALLIIFVESFLLIVSCLCILSLFYIAIQILLVKYSEKEKREYLEKWYFAYSSVDLKRVKLYTKLRFLGYSEDIISKCLDYEHLVRQPSMRRLLEWYLIYNKRKSSSA